MGAFDIVQEIAALEMSIDYHKGLRDKCKDADRRLLLDAEIQRQMEKVARFRVDHDRELARVHGPHAPCHHCGSRAGAKDLSNVFCFTCGGML